MSDLKLLPPQQVSPSKEIYLSEESSTPEEKFVYSKGTASASGHRRRGFGLEYQSPVGAVDYKGFQQPYGMPYVNIEGSVWSYPKSLATEFLLSAFNNFMQKTPPEQLTLSEVFINQKKITLSKPLLLNIQLEDNHYIVSYDDLGLLAISSSLKQALREIQEEFSELWEEYVNCPDNELTEGAKRLKTKLQSVVE